MKKYIIAIILLTISLFGCNKEQEPVELDSFQTSSIELLNSEDKVLVAQNNDIVAQEEGQIGIRIFSGEVYKITYTEDQSSKGIEGNSRFIDVTEHIIRLNLEITNNSDKIISYEMIPVEIITTDGITITNLIFVDRLDITLDNNHSTNATVIVTIPSDEDVESIEILLENNIKIDYPLEISYSENQYALLDNAHLENVPDNLKIPMRAEVGDVGIVLES